VLLVQDGALLDVDVVLVAFCLFGVVWFHGRHVVADFALQADVGDQSLVGFRVDARQVAGVGIAVGVAVSHVEEEDEIIAVFDGAVVFASCRFLVFLDVKVLSLLKVTDDEAALLFQRELFRKGKGRGHGGAELAFVKRS